VRQLRVTRRRRARLDDGAAQETALETLPPGSTCEGLDEQCAATLSHIDEALATT
jgi:hypothetical protein